MNRLPKDMPESECCIKDGSRVTTAAVHAEAVPSPHWHKRTTDVKSALARVQGGEGALAILVPDNKCANNN